MATKPQTQEAPKAPETKTEAPAQQTFEAYVKEREAKNPTRKAGVGRFLTNLLIERATSNPENPTMSVSELGMAAALAFATKYPPERYGSLLTTVKMVKVDFGIVNPKGWRCEGTPSTGFKAVRVE